jgi:hypothetical protein
MPVRPHITYPRRFEADATAPRGGDEQARPEAVPVLEVAALAALVQGDGEEDVARAHDEAGVSDGGGEREAEEGRDLFPGVPAPELEAGLGPGGGA